MPPNIVSGPLIRPMSLLFYGVEGIGKTTFAHQLAQTYGRTALFCDTEYGTRLDVARVHVHTMTQWDELITFLLKEKHSYDTLIIDTVTSLEPLVENERVLVPPKYTDSGKKITRMGDFPYGRGSILLREEFDRILYLQLDELIKAGISVWTIGHSQVERVNLPELVEGFDKYGLAMDKRVSATLRQWHDNVLFANWDTRYTTNEADQTRGLAGKERFIYTQHAATYDAKNRAHFPEKLAWDVKLLGPLFPPGTAADVAPVQPAPQTKVGSAEPDQAVQVFIALMEKIKPSKFPVNGVEAFFQSRFPNFDGTNPQIIPLKYLQQALERSEAFTVTINEFLAKPQAS